jgi:hypothetical protein
MSNNHQHINPLATREEVPYEAALRSREDPLVCSLAFVEVDGLGAGSPVNVAEDVESRLDAPDFAEQMGAAEEEVEVGFRGRVSDEDVG